MRGWRGANAAFACLVLAAGAPAVAQPAGPPAPAPIEWVRESAQPASEFKGPERLAELDGPDGWIRTRQIHSDFTLRIEFRLGTPASEAVVGLRTLHRGTRSPVAGYRLLLASGRAPELMSAADPVRPHTTPAALPIANAGGWHTLTVTALGRQLSVAMDEQTVAAYDVDVFAGAVFLESLSGPVAFRYPAIESQLPVGAVMLTRLLDPALEHAGLAALRQWRFKPGLRDGKPVRTLVEIDMTFTLKR